MAAIGSEPAAMRVGAKIVTLPASPTASGPSHPGTVILIDPATGRPLATFDADAVTAIRTAATTAAVTRRFRPGANSFTIIGTGTEARSHLSALSAVYPAAAFTVWGRSPQRASELVADFPPGRSVSAEKNLADSLRNADVITSTTGSSSPFLDANAVASHAHINAIGASIRGLAEWTPESFEVASFIACDNVVECGRQSQEVPTGALARSRDVAELLTPNSAAIESQTGLSFYKSVGSAVLDIAAAVFLLELAES